MSQVIGWGHHHKNKRRRVSECLYFCSCSCHTCHCRPTTQHNTSLGFTLSHFPSFIRICLSYQTWMVVAFTLSFCFDRFIFVSALITFRFSFCVVYVQSWTTKRDVTFWIEYGREWEWERNGRDVTSGKWPLKCTRSIDWHGLPPWPMM